MLSNSTTASGTASGTSQSLDTFSSTITFLAQATDNYVEAYGIIVRRSEGDPEWSTTSSTTAGTTTSDEETGTTTSDEQTDTTSGTSTSTLSTSTSEPASSGGLSPGASAGIGVGVAIGCIIFISCIVAAYVIGKRRRKNAAQGPDGPEDPPREDGIPVQEQSAPLTGSEYKPWEQPGGGYQPPAPEMDGHGYRREMDGHGYTREMDGHGYTREMDGNGYRREMDANNHNHPVELQASEGHGQYR